MSTDEYLEKLFADAFKREVDQDEAIWRSLPFFSTALGLTGALLSYVASHLPALVAQPWSIILHLLLAFAGMSLTVSAGWLVEAVRPREYQYLPAEDATLDYGRRLRSYYIQSGKTEDEAELATIVDLRAFITEELSAVTSENRRHNAKKQHARTQSLVYLIGSGLLAASISVAMFVEGRMESAPHGTRANGQGVANVSAQAPGAAKAVAPAAAVPH